MRRFEKTAKRAQLPTKPFVRFEALISNHLRAQRFDDCLLADLHTCGFAVFRRRLPADAIALLSEEITLLAVRNGWARWMTDLQGSIEGQSMQCRIEYPLDDAPGTTELLKGPSWRTLNVQIEASLS